jgi:hypothetical protein
MGNRFASAKNSIAICDRCGFQFKLTTLRKEVVKTKINNTLVCSSCWDPDQPQLQLGMYPVDDPQAVRNPRRDTTYVTAGVNTEGFNTGGSRFFDNALTPNNLALSVEVGTVTVQIGV